MNLARWNWNFERYGNRRIGVPQLWPGGRQCEWLLWNTHLTQPHRLMWPGSIVMISSSSSITIAVVVVLIVCLAIWYLIKFSKPHTTGVLPPFYRWKNRVQRCQVTSKQNEWFINGRTYQKSQSLSNCTLRLTIKWHLVRMGLYTIATTSKHLANKFTNVYFIAVTSYPKP